jgi:hypothetical protein
MCLCRVPLRNCLLGDLGVCVSSTADDRGSVSPVVSVYLIRCPHVTWMLDLHTVN